MKKSIILSGVAVFGLIGAASATTTAAGAEGTAQVSVVHGIPDTPVNVFVDGKSVLPDFKPGSVAGPLSLPAGSHEVTVFPASNTAGTGTPVIKADASVAAEKNYSLVAHLTTAGKPTLTAYENDVGPVPAGQARLVVRHDAAAPAVDVRANGKVAFANLANPDQAMADLPAGTVSADVVLAGTSTVALGPADLNLKEGTATIAYATGSASDKSLALVTQTIDGLHSAPAGVPAGSGGLVDRGAGTPGWVLATAAIGFAVAVTAAAGLYRARREPAALRAPR
ncbi:MAG TPA: DUF4397 domain-containing protein [Jatrophihabitans sp.]|nr:DUF4397 domain-containing protein [Jatrophihabitans sp.]